MRVRSRGLATKFIFTCMVFYAVTLSLSQRWLLACDPVTLGYIIYALSFSAWLDHVVVLVFFCCHTLHRVNKLRAGTQRRL